MRPRACAESENVIRRIGRSSTMSSFRPLSIREGHSWSALDPALRSPEAWVPLRKAPRLGLFATRAVAILIDASIHDGEPFVCEYVESRGRISVRLGFKGDDPSALTVSANEALTGWRRWRQPRRVRAFRFELGDVEAATSRLRQERPAAPTRRAKTTRTA